MNHPFSLRLEDLEVLDFEVLEADATRGGSAEVTTLAIGEEGGQYPSPQPPTKFPPSWWNLPTPRPRPIKPPIKPPIFTTLALGEEGGDYGLLE